MHRISVIIPVYNVEAQLIKCLDSVINQTYGNLEIIIINDGSTDGCGEICNKYTNKNKKIHVIHQQNKGLSAALNTGLDHCSGDYIGFVDSDDWTEAILYEKLYQRIISKSVDISVCSFYIANDIGSSEVSNAVQIPLDKICAEDIIRCSLERDSYKGFCGYVWNKLFAAKVIKEKRLRFDEDIKYGMDTLFFLSFVLASECDGSYINQPLYHYYQRDTAISKSTNYDIKLDILKVYKRVESMLNNTAYEHLAYLARGFYCYHASIIAEIAIRINDAEMLKHMKDAMSAHLDDYIATNTKSPQKIERIYELLTK